MSIKHRFKTALVLAGTVAASFAVFGPATAQAFYPQGHDSITRNGLPADQVDPAALLQIEGDLTHGAGSVGSDFFAKDAFRHFDNAKNPAEICERATEAWNFFTPRILDGARAAGPDGSGLIDGHEARSAFGGLLHAAQDFYSHTNWVLDNVEANTPEALANVFPTCNPADLPDNLYSGFFSLDYGTEGCPPSGPPAGFPQCHETLSMDNYSTPQGGKLLPEGVSVPGVPLLNYYDLASLLATRATTDLYYQVRGLVVESVNSNGGNGECVANNLFQADRHEACGGSVGDPAPAPAKALLGG